ncbi:MAG: hypothetical protein ACJA0Q_001537, partial [Saprospiraceae bacterium]
KKESLAHHQFTERVNSIFFSPVKLQLNAFYQGQNFTHY